MSNKMSHSHLQISINYPSKVRGYIAMQTTEPGIDTKKKTSVFKSS